MRTISVKLDEALDRALGELAERRGESRSAVIREALDRYVRAGGESVLSEACFLVRRLLGGPEAVLQMISRGAVAIGFRLESESAAVRRLLGKYADVPMSLADACLVRMTELERQTEVLTVDRDFTIYRRNRRKVIPVRRPPDR